MSPQYLCVKKPLKMANDRRNGDVHVTSQLNYSTITLSSEKSHSKKQNNFVISLFILAKVAAKWQLLTLLFRNSEGDNKSQICDLSRYFSRKGKKLVANATVLVAISSPERPYSLGERTKASSMQSKRSD